MELLTMVVFLFIACSPKRLFKLLLFVPFTMGSGRTFSLFFDSFFNSTRIKCVFYRADIEKKSAKCIFVE